VRGEAGGDGTIRFDVDEGIGWLELNRPDAANARNQQMRRELTAVYDRVAHDHDVRVLVLTAVGDRFFCAGMDLKEAAGPETPLGRRARLQTGRDIEQLAALPVPTIAAVNGFALGGGLEMALACDLRIAAEEAELGLPEITHGLIPGGGATQRLPALVGPGQAFELLYLGERVNGRRAADIGLVNRSVPRDRLADEARQLARRIAKRPAPALRLLKEAVLNGLELPPAAARSAELDLLLTLMADRAAVPD
jgi:enoyl-CoA hydratase